MLATQILDGACRLAQWRDDPWIPRPNIGPTYINPPRQLTYRALSQTDHSKQDTQVKTFNLLLGYYALLLAVS